MPESRWTLGPPASPSPSRCWARETSHGDGYTTCRFSGREQGTKQVSESRAFESQECQSQRVTTQKVLISSVFIHLRSKEETVGLLEGRGTRSRRRWERGRRGQEEKAASRGGRPGKRKTRGGEREGDGQWGRARSSVLILTTASAAQTGRPPRSRAPLDA